MNWKLNQTFESSYGTISWDVLGDGPSIVLIHGTPSSSYLWRDVANVLAGNWTVYVYDLLGFGNSAKYDGLNTSLAIQTKVFAELLDHWKLSRPFIAGHDIGAAVALRTLILEQREYRGMALLDAVAIAPWNTEFSRLVRDNQSVFKQLPIHIFEAMMEANIRSAVHREMTGDELEPYMAQWRGAEGLAAYLRNNSEFYEKYTLEIEGHYKDIGIPTIVLWGERDQWLPLATGRQLSNIIPNSKFCIIPDAGHFSQEDNYELIANYIAEFFSQK